MTLNDVFDLVEDTDVCIVRCDGIGEDITGSAGALKLIMSKNVLNSECFGIEADNCKLRIWTRNLEYEKLCESKTVKA